MTELSLVLPVINEAQTIEAVVGQLKRILAKAKIDFELILVENCSTDGTLDIIKKFSRQDKRIRVLVAAPKNCYGGKIITGLKVAKGKYVGYLPSDGQADATVIVQMLSLVKSDQVDLTVAKRTNRETWLRLINSRVFNFIANCLFNLKIKDINGDPKIFRRSELKKLNLVSLDSFINCELLLKARRFNWRIIEVPNRSWPRRHGRSTVNLLTVVEFWKNMWVWKWGKNRNLL